LDNSTVRGSYTVEAALILPIILFIIIGLLYLGFYLHDMVKIQSKLDETSLKGREFIQYETDLYTGLVHYSSYRERTFLYPYFVDFSEKENTLTTYLRKQFDAGLFITKIDFTKVSVASNKISLLVQGHIEIPFQEVIQLLFPTGIDLQKESQVEIHNPVEFIRIFDVFSGALEKVKYIDEILQKLKNILNFVK